MEASKGNGGDDDKAKHACSIIYWPDPTLHNIEGPKLSVADV